MLRQFIFWLCIFNAAVATAQQDTSFTKQCAAIREIIYLFSNNNMDALIDLRLKGSSGYQVNGVWKFSNEHFSTILPWAGASSTTVEHSTDERDSTYLESWQYIATFKTISYATTATQFHEKIVTQINACVLPINDSTTLTLQPVDPAELPPTKPDNLADAYLFVLPVATGATKEISIMTGLEKVRYGYRPMLMVERTEERKK